MGVAGTLRSELRLTSSQFFSLMRSVFDSNELFDDSNDLRSAVRDSNGGTKEGETSPARAYITISQVSPRGLQL